MSSSSTGPKLKVAIIHPDLGIGGAERLIVDAAVELSLHGHDVHIFTAHHDKHRCFEETISDQVSIVIPLMKMKSGKVVFYCHFPDLLLAKHTTFLRKLYRKPIDMVEEATTGMADLLLVNSKFTAATFASTFRSLHSKGIEPEVLYPAVNVEQFNQSCDYKLNFLSINRFERKKNIQLAISAFAALKSIDEDAQSNASLTIAGGFDKRLKENVEYLEELKKLAEMEGVSNRVKFITSCSTEERNMLLSQCICVVYTPENEHFGIVPLEAMAAQKPVIACNCGGPVETIKHEVTGFLCSAAPQEFALAMSKLILNPDMARKMGKEARNHVTRNFSTTTFGERLNRYIINVHHQRVE